MQDLNVKENTTIGKQKENVRREVNFSKKKIFWSLFFVLLAVGIVFLIFLKIKAQQREKELRIGFITDVHCYSKENKDTGEWETNWRCIDPMTKFVDQMNQDFKPDFVIENGDLVDGRDRKGDDGFLRAKEIYDKIKAPKFHVLGNHETDNFTKERWMEITGYEKTYYYFDIKDYRIIVLDGNNLLDSSESGKIIDMSPETPHEYKGRVDEEQLKWLENVLKEAQGLKKLVFIHEPPLDQSIGRAKGDIFLEPERLRKIFSKGGVMAVFSGHIEEICDVTLDGVRYFSLKGFHKRNSMLPKEHQYKDKGIFHEVTIDQNSINIEMFYNEGKGEPYKSILINQESAICNNNTLPK